MLSPEQQQLREEQDEILDQDKDNTLVMFNKLMHAKRVREPFINENPLKHIKVPEMIDSKKGGQLNMARNMLLQRLYKNKP